MSTVLHLLKQIPEGTQSVESESVPKLVLTLDDVRTLPVTNSLSCRVCDLVAPIPSSYNSSGHVLLGMKGFTLPLQLLPTLASDARSCPAAISPMAVPIPPTLI